MIHQDLQQRGTNPMVEVFRNRIEFSNAGAPLVAIGHILDSVPVSRNENIAGFMHKCGICEERGSDMIRSSRQPERMNCWHRGWKTRIVSLQRPFYLPKSV